MSISTQALEVLEQLAENANFRVNAKELLIDKSDSLQEAILSNNSDQLKKQCSSSNYFADTCKVVEN